MKTKSKSTKINLEKQKAREIRKSQWWKNRKAKNENLLVRNKPTSKKQSKKLFLLSLHNNIAKKYMLWMEKVEAKN